MSSGMQEIAGAEFKPITLRTFKSPKYWSHMALPQVLVTKCWSHRTLGSSHLSAGHIGL